MDIGLTAILALLAGLACAALGGELFVRGVVGLAAWARVPSGIIAATFAAFATSSPELIVGVTAAIDRTPEIALGNALGANLVNVGVVVGVTILLAALVANPRAVRRDVPVVMVAPLLTVVLGLDGQISRTDATVLILLFALWLTIVAREARREREATPAVLGEQRHGRAIGSAVAGLAVLAIAGQLVVGAATDIGAALGWEAFLAGALIATVATSTPEMATALIARIRRHDDIGLGTVLGSNIFNNLAIVGVVGLLRPIDVATSDLLVTGIGAMVLVALLVPGQSGILGRPRGVALVLGYVALVALLFAVQP
jgi:cation:H+ antiporter